jgi:hypothetical protein
MTESETDVHIDATRWRHRAACRGKTDVMYPEGKNGPGGGYDYAPAKKLCAICVVHPECEEEMLANYRAFDDMHGGPVVAGYTPEERHRLRRRYR